MTAQNAKIIALYQMGSFSHVNAILAMELAKMYPQCEVQVLDLRDSMHLWDRVCNVFVAFKEYGRDIVLRKRSFKDCREHTSYFMAATRRIAHASIATKDLAFTFQTQSMFDASRPSVPHFLYTDHTHLANLGYPIFKREMLFPQWWINKERSIYHNTTVNFTMSERIAASIREDYGCPPEQVACVYAGSSLGNVSPPQEEQFGRQNILFIGLDWERKGGPVLQKAFAIVHDCCPEATLTIVGCTPQCTIPNCTVVGRVPLADVAQYYQKASVFCLPTRLEPFGNVFIEAMTHGLPVVGTRIGAIPEFIQDGVNGYLVEPDDAQALADALIRLIRDPRSCQEMGEQGKQLVTERYTWDAVRERMRYHIGRHLVH